MKKQLFNTDTNLAIVFIIMLWYIGGAFSGLYFLCYLLYNVFGISGILFGVILFVGLASQYIWKVISDDETQYRR